MKGSASLHCCAWEEELGVGSVEGINSRRGSWKGKPGRSVRVLYRQAPKFKLPSVS